MNLMPNISIVRSSTFRNLKFNDFIHYYLFNNLISVVGAVEYFHLN